MPILNLSTSPVMEFAIALDPQSNLPLHRQVYEALRQLILAGKLLPKQRLPSTRALAKSLAISRATVTQSYEQLISEGYLQTISGGGTYVCDFLPEEFLHSKRTLQPNTDCVTDNVNLSTYGTNLITNAPLYSPRLSLPIEFCYGQPALDAFPLNLWRQLISRHCRQSDRLMLDYATDSLGYQPLRDAIARYLIQSRAVQCNADQIIIVGGSQQALDLVSRVAIDPGDGIAVEDPGYLGARHVFLSQAAKLYPIPVDSLGMQIEQLYHLSNIKLVYITPSHQFPTGALLSLARRLELLAWAKQTGGLIIEDDYDSEFRYEGRPIPALQGLDRTNSVLYIGTFSKVLFPSLRIAYLVVPPKLVNVFARAKWLVDRQSPLLEQYVLTDFINEGHLERHIRRMRALYDRRRQALVGTLANYFGDRITICGENAGMHLMVRLFTNLSDRTIIERARAVGVGLVSARQYYLKNTCNCEFVLGYADLDEAEIANGVQKLAAAIN